MAGGIREDIARFSVYIVRILAYVVGMLYLFLTVISCLFPKFELILRKSSAKSPFGALI